MTRSKSLRRLAAALALAALLAPGPVRVQAATTSGSGGPTTDSLFGALMGVACGAGINVSRMAPEPIVVTITAVTCALMMMDALATADAP